MFQSVAYASKSLYTSNMETMEPDNGTPTIVSVSGRGRRTGRLVEAAIPQVPTDDASRHEDEESQSPPAPDPSPQQP